MVLRNRKPYWWFYWKWYRNTRYRGSRSHRDRRRRYREDNGLGPNTQETISTIESAEGIGSAENPDNLDPKEVVNTIGNIQKTSVKTIVDTEEPTKYFENTPVTGTSDHMKADAEEAIFIENQMREAAHGSK